MAERERLPIWARRVAPDSPKRGFLRLPPAVQLPSSPSAHSQAAGQLLFSAKLWLCPVPRLSKRLLRPRITAQEIALPQPFGTPFPTWISSGRLPHLLREAFDRYPLLPASGRPWPGPPLPLLSCWLLIRLWAFCLHQSS